MVLHAPGTSVGTKFGDNTLEMCSNGEVDLDESLAAKVVASKTKMKEDYDDGTMMIKEDEKGEVKTAESDIIDAADGEVKTSDINAATEDTFEKSPPVVSTETTDTDTASGFDDTLKPGAAVGCGWSVRGVLFSVCGLIIKLFLPIIMAVVVGALFFPRTMDMPYTVRVAILFLAVTIRAILAANFIMVKVDRLVSGWYFDSAMSHASGPARESLTMMLNTGTTLFCLAFVSLFVYVIWLNKKKNTT
jgi:hypothetical protein